VKMGSGHQWCRVCGLSCTPMCGNHSSARLCSHLGDCGFEFQCHRKFIAKHRFFAAGLQ